MKKKKKKPEETGIGREGRRERDLKKPLGKRLWTKGQAGNES